MVPNNYFKDESVHTTLNDTNILDFIINSNLNKSVQKIGLEYYRPLQEESLRYNKPKPIKIIEINRNNGNFCFIDTHKYFWRLNLTSEGLPPSLFEGRSSSSRIDTRFLNSREYSDFILEKLPKINQFFDINITKLRMLSSYSADGGDKSFAAQVANNTGLIVKAYEGALNLRMSADSLIAITEKTGGLFNFQKMPIASSLMGVERLEKWKPQTSKVLPFYKPDWTPETNPRWNFLNKSTWIPVNNSRQFSPKPTETSKNAINYR